MDRLLSKKDVYSIETTDEFNKVVEDAKPAWEKYKELKTKLCALEAMNQEKDATLQKYITEFKATEIIKIEHYEQIRTDQ